MMIMSTRRVALAGTGLALLLALASCVAGVGYVPDSGYDTDVGVGYSPGYIEPYGYAVGGWGGWGGYRVGPGRGGEPRSSAPSHAYRGASGSHATPSIPHGARGGTSRSHP
jgi:hypothetical protein